jgi:hypothetical protein
VLARVKRAVWMKTPGDRLQRWTVSTKSWRSRSSRGHWRRIGMKAMMGTKKTMKAVRIVKVVQMIVDKERIILRRVPIDEDGCAQQKG